MMQGCNRQTIAKATMQPLHAEADKMAHVDMCPGTQAHTTRPCIARVIKPVATRPLPLPCPWRHPPAPAHLLGRRMNLALGPSKLGGRDRHLCRCALKVQGITHDHARGGAGDGGLGLEGDGKG